MLHIVPDATIRCAQDDQQPLIHTEFKKTIIDIEGSDASYMWKYGESFNM